MHSCSGLGEYHPCAPHFGTGGWHRLAQGWQPTNRTTPNWPVTMAGRCVSRLLKADAVQVPKLISSLQEAPGSALRVPREPLHSLRTEHTTPTYVEKTLAQGRRTFNVKGEEGREPLGRPPASPPKRAQLTEHPKTHPGIPVVSLEGVGGGVGGSQKAKGGAVGRLEGEGSLRVGSGLPLNCDPATGGATPRFWTPTTPPTNCWPEAPWGGGGGETRIVAHHSGDH